MHQLTTIIPVYNGEPYLVETLASLAKQTRRPDRLIVLDDQSTDRTREIAASYPGLQCEVIRNPKNLGLFGNHNRALALASETQYWHVLHANDLILPDFYSRLMPLAEGIQGRGMVFCGHEFIGENGEPLAPRRSTPQPPRELTRKQFIASQAELKSIQLHSAVLKTGGQPSPIQFRMDFPQVADCVFHSQWAEVCEKIIEVREVLCQVRVHANSTTSKNIKNVQAWSLDEWRAMDLISALIPESGASRWLRRQKLKCLYAARTHVKIQVMREADPNYAREIAGAARRLVSSHHWALGGLAVTARNVIHGTKAQHPQVAARKQSA